MCEHVIMPVRMRGTQLPGPLERGFAGSACFGGSTSGFPGAASWLRLSPGFQPGYYQGVSESIKTPFISAPPPNFTLHSPVSLVDGTGVRHKNGHAHSLS